MTTYYYALYDDNYNDYYEQRTSRTMKNALAGLRQVLSDQGYSGVITTKRIPEKPMEKNPNGYLGRMVRKDYARSKRPYYIWYAKGKKKGQMVMSDGSLRPYEGR